MKKFGGIWTNTKLDAFINYVKAYTRILNNVKAKYGWETIYFDGFAGFGERKTEKLINSNLIDYFPKEEEYNIYQGSVKRVIDLPEEYGFDYYYFIDNNQEYIDELENLKSQLNKDIQKRVIIRKDDCNNQLIKLSLALKKGNYASLILLDPFGMQINWESIMQLGKTRSDIWILVPSGIAVNRLLDKKMQLKSVNRLETFFGLPKDKIEEIFYRIETKPTLFGEVESINKIYDPINRIAQIYIQQLQTIWKHVTIDPLRLINSKNCPIFHFIFASNNPVGLKIASEIINS